MVFAIPAALGSKAEETSFGWIGTNRNFKENHLPHYEVWDSVYHLCNLGSNSEIALGF